MYPILFKLGSFSLRSYGLFVASGFLIGILFAAYLAKKESIDPENILGLSVYVLISSIIGARLFYVIEFWPLYKNNPLEIFAIWQGGLVFWGGVIVALPVLVAIIKLQKLPLWKILDLGAPALMLGYAIGRVGCFLNGCCSGIPTNLPWGIIFPPFSEAGRQFPGLVIHPTQIYESIYSLLIFFTLMYLFKRRKFDGQIFSFGVMFYSIGRFLNEFFRINPRYFFGLSEAQLIAVIMFAIGCGVYLFLNRKSK